MWAAARTHHYDLNMIMWRYVDAKTPEEESPFVQNKLEFERRLMHMNKITKITFKQQVFIGIILIIAGNVLALILHKGLFANIAWILYGLILILNPVYPEKYSNDEKRAKLGSRIAGIICILAGILMRYIP